MKFFTWMTIVMMVPMVMFPSLCLAVDAVTHEDVLRVNPALSLRDALDATIKHRPQQAQLQSQQYDIQSKQALANSLFPQSPALSLYHQNDALGSGRNEQDFQAELELPLWLNNQRSARLKVAEMSAKHYEASQAGLAIQAAGLLRDALWEIALRKNTLLLSEAKHESAMALQEKVNRSVLAGESAKTDLLLAQQETLQAAKNSLLAEAEVMHARFRYKLLTGLDDLPKDFVEEKSQLTSFEDSPAWLEMLTKVQYAEQSRQLAQIEKKENMQVLINARSSQGAFDTQYNQSMGVRVRIPLNIAARTAPVTAVAEMRLGDAQSERDLLSNALEAALHEADHNLEVSEQELVIAEQHHAIAKESLRLAEKAYALGEHDLATLIRIKSQAFDAERSYRAMQLQRQWNIARYNQAVGVLP
jgi:outer membrane protein, heavy metal efflux system